MNATFERYLDTVDKCLKPLPTSERVDIVKEIKGSIIEMENDNLSTEQILDRLGSPKDLAKAYLGDLLDKGNNTRFSFNRFLTICAFYSIVGFSGMVVIPCLAIMAPTFIVCGIASPFLGAIKAIDYIFNLRLPFVQGISVFLGGLIQINPIVEFGGSFITGALLYFAGRWFWKVLLSYCKKVSNTKKALSN